MLYGKNDVEFIDLSIPCVNYLLFSMSNAKLIIEAKYPDIAFAFHGRKRKHS